MKNIVLTLTIALCSLSVSNAAPVTFVDTFVESPGTSRKLQAMSGSSFTVKDLSAGNNSYLQSIWIQSLDGDTFQTVSLTLYENTSTTGTTWADRGNWVGISAPGAAVAESNGGGVTFDFASDIFLQNEEKYLFAFSNTDGTLGETVSVWMTDSDVYSFGNAFYADDQRFEQAIENSDIAMRITAFSPVAVPEPASLAFLGIGAAGFAIHRHRNRRSNVSLA